MSTTEKRRSFRELLQSGSFAYGAELVTTRGFVTPEQPNKLADLGDALRHDRRIGWISITDNPGGNPMLPPDWLARSLHDGTAHVVLHLTCKDMNRNALEARAWQYASEGFENLVAMTGDYPRAGFGGTASPVFDLDSVSLLALLNAMNHGLPVPGRGGETKQLPKTNFHLGCVVSPFKRHERELMPQYLKLLRKIANGAQYVYTQVGYDLRKFHEVKLLLESHSIRVPVIGNVYLLNRTVAGMFHRQQVPGCVVSDELHAKIEKYAGGPDKGRAFFLELAAKMLAAFRALGFAGGYLGGIAKAETFFEVIDESEKYSVEDGLEFAKEIQYPQPHEFYLFDHSPSTRLGDVTRLNPEYVASLSDPPKSPHVTLGYRLSKFMHDRVFVPGTIGFRLMKRLYGRWDKKPTALSRGSHELEKISKFVWFGCRDCGDCSLPDTGYICPLASCSKGARNGPCGGSSDGQCELQDKECIWARAYDRYKHEQRTDELLAGPAVFYKAELKGTSAWANTFLGRDHHSSQSPPEAGASTEKRTGDGAPAPKTTEAPASLPRKHSHAH